MVKSGIITTNVEEMNFKDILMDRRNKAMSLLNLHLNVSYFNINIHIQKDEAKQREKTRKILAHEMRMKEEFNRRRNQDYQHMLYNIIR
ncbi:hypothetical protein [Geosporobacter ferrireducens]|uniref:Uncharacterized protein n=1 Tax=Geosporobacter ferrireducens TaxID=1424294 RepID=A0A1D8GCE7_9FIRM|nr:hypothetical protein [Geosporobacter ferrireducens]AOT68584.1 hypothetical protein Gferi_02620 [Geosporobacter ferrireducens]MTI54053.1 hypothetical protein [Geosporobacter ferrireducens]